MDKHWRSVLLSRDATLQNAIELLGAASLRIVLVVSEDGVLLGTITDGDARRALLAGKKMSVPVTMVMETRPYTIKECTTRQAAIRLMRDRDLLHLPVLDDLGRVTGLETLGNAAFPDERDNNVLIMAGGFGKRLLPLTTEIPKPLLPVGNTPVLELILNQLSNDGFSNFYFSIHYHGDKVREHFGDGSRWGVNIKYIEESEPLGTAGALGLIDRDLLAKPMLVMNADLITQLKFGDLIDFHSQNSSVATVAVREHEYQIPFGVVTGNKFEVSEIQEKPFRREFVNAGIYALDSVVLDYVEVGIPLDMPTLLNKLLQDQKKVGMFPIHEPWLDIGRMADYQKAQSQGFN